MKILHRFQHKLPAVGTVILMLFILLFVWQAAREPFFSIFYGYLPRDILFRKFFSQKFDIGHAGTVLDQPTIGKWLFWFSFLTIVSLPYAAGVRWLSRQGNRIDRLAYGIPAVLLGIFLLCILSWPVCWLIQYVCSMGFTTRRICGLAYELTGGILILAFVFWSCKNPQKDGKASSVFFMSMMISFAALVMGGVFTAARIINERIFGFCFIPCLLMGPCIVVFMKKRFKRKSLNQSSQVSIT